MSEFEYHKAGATEAQQKQALAYLFSQAVIGKADTGVLSGLEVTAETTASKNVRISAGAGVVQAATLNGASLMVNDTLKTLDVLTANPMGATPRNDVVVFDQATGSIRVIVGTPSSTPADPTVPTSAIKLARLSHIAGATVINSGTITDLRTYTALHGAETVGRLDNVLGSSGRRVGWDRQNMSFSGGDCVVTHGLGFTPSNIQITATPGSNIFTVGLKLGTINSTTFTVRCVAMSSSGVVSDYTGSLSDVHWVAYE